MADDKILDNESEENDEIALEEIESDNVASNENKPKKAKKPVVYEEEEEKVSFFARIGRFFKAIGKKLKKMFKNMKSELGKVTWYSRKQTFNSTLLVLIVIGISAVVIAALDFGSSKIIEWLAEAYYQITRMISKRG